MAPSRVSVKTDVTQREKVYWKAPVGEMTELQVSVAAGAFDVNHCGDADADVCHVGALKFAIRKGYFFRGEPDVNGNYLDEV